MWNNCASLVRNCRPLVIVAEDSATGPRFGGLPPEGIQPARARGGARYFATLPLDERNGRELSIFTTLEDDSNQDPVHGQRCRVHGGDTRWVQFVVHSPRARAKRSRLEAAFSSHALRIDPERPDARTEEEGMWTQHKIGGYPFFYRKHPDMLQAVDSLMADGFFHLLQMSAPGYGETFATGEWPFGDYMFHVFSKESSPSSGFRYIWG